MKKFDVSVEIPGFTSSIYMSEALSEDALARFNETNIAEGTFPEGVNNIVSASVSGDADDIEDDEAKVFVSVSLNVSAKTEEEAAQIAEGTYDLLVSLADALARQAGGSIELDECEPDILEASQAVAA